MYDYAELARASYGDSLEAARALSRACAALLAAPSEQTLSAARAAWLAARIPYAQTEVFRFYEGPIDRVELLVNSWPIDESYLEASEPGAPKGLLDDDGRHPILTSELLVALNAKEGETSISTGYHVLEFLLWGPDQSEHGPGRRASADFVASFSDPVVARRRTYLSLASELLVRHLEEVERAWSSDAPKSYRSRFLALPPAQGLALVIKGMGALSGAELAGERLTVPYETRDQENEHSCFSDSTDRDLVHDVLGIQNVCLGRYRRSDGSVLEGTGLCAVVRALDPALGDALARQIAESMAAVASIPAPFDRALLGADTTRGRRAIRRTIDALEAQTATLARAGAALGDALGPAKASR